MSLAKATSTLFNHIAHVFVVSTEKKVRGFTTGFVIAFVANEQSFRNRTMRKDVGKSMGSLIAVFKTIFTVASEVFPSQPQPAITAPINLRPKTFNCLLGFCKSNAFIGAILPIL